MSGDAGAGTVDLGSNSLSRLMRVLLGAVAACAIALALAHGTGVFAAIGIGAIIFLSAFAVGSLLGFLFGVPRVLSKETGASQAAQPNTAEASVGDTPAADGSRKPGARLLQSNTNLERISDWLTTMLVGAGLVELHRINDALLMFRGFLTETATVFPAAVRGEVPTAGAIPTVGPMILVFGATAGFLYMYLNTRLVLIRLFQSIEETISGTALPPAEQRVVRQFATGSDGERSFVSQQLNEKRNPTVEDALSLMFDLLYKNDPDRVVELGSQLSRTDAVQRADYWFYLAAAFGQKLHQLEHGGNEWRSARDNALDCARRAVAIDKGYASRLWYISDPNSTDNDLAVLRDDPTFRSIAGRD